MLLIGSVLREKRQRQPLITEPNATGMGWAFRGFNGKGPAEEILVIVDRSDREFLSAIW